MNVIKFPESKSRSEKEEISHKPRNTNMLYKALFTIIPFLFILSKASNISFNVSIHNITFINIVNHKSVHEPSESPKKKTVGRGLSESVGDFCKGSACNWKVRTNLVKKYDFERKLPKQSRVKNKKRYKRLPNRKSSDVKKDKHLQSKEQSKHKFEPESTEQVKNSVLPDGDGESVGKNVLYNGEQKKRNFKATLPEQVDVEATSRWAPYIWND